MCCSIITIFGIVSGSSGASLGVGVMFIIGMASLCADAISMYESFSSFLPFQSLPTLNLTIFPLNRAVSDYMSQIAEKEMEKYKAQQQELDAERGEDSLQRRLSDHLMSRKPGGMFYYSILCMLNFFCSLLTPLNPHLSLFNCGSSIFIKTSCSRS